MVMSLCAAYSANPNPDSRIAELISTESQAVLIPRILPPGKSGRSVGPLFFRSATHVGKVPQSCPGNFYKASALDLFGDRANCTLSKRSGGLVDTFTFGREG